MIDSTILLPNYNNERVLSITFEKLRQHIDCSQVRLVAVDDGSEDDGLRVLKEEAARCGFASVDIIERPHEGIVPALNAGLEATKTEFVFRIDGDAFVLLKDWTTRMKRFLRDPAVGLVGGHTINNFGFVCGYGRSVIGESGLYDIGAMPLEPIGSRTFDSYVWRPCSEFPGGPAYEADTVLGTCTAFRLEDARAVGGFDMAFNPVWIEDDDFGLLVRRLNKKVIIAPEVKILHDLSLRGSRKPGDESKKRASGGAQSKSGVGGFFTTFRSNLAETLCPRPVNFSAFKGVFPGTETGWRAEVLCKHYRTWKEKWGFDPLNPDMDYVLDRYFDTELCWRYNRDRYRAGRRIVADLG